jgi:hypothetical protein
MNFTLDSDRNFLQRELLAYEAEHGAVAPEYAAAMNAGCSGDCYGSCEGSTSCICGGSCSGTCVGGAK